MTDAADSPLLDFLLAVLASIMATGLGDTGLRDTGLGDTGLGDAGLARRAAVQAIEAFRPQGTHELIATGQILSFALAALDTLRLSAPPDLSLPMKLRARANANGLNRAARDNTRILQVIRQTPANKPAKPAEPAAMAGRQEPEVPIAAPSRTAPIQDWASAMNTVAARLRAGTPAAAPGQRTIDGLWIDALTGVAAEIARAKHRTTGPGRCKAALLRTTHLTTASLETRPIRSDLNRDGIWAGRVGTVASPTDRLSDRDQPAT